ncbi:MAG: carbohydrate binding family 9 domain-containing protein [Acidobacteriota bacterium]|nr:MAG: carbohydrate binding family 9 domain-containing protein [Acidobacteriota bacterium]
MKFLLILLFAFLPSPSDNKANESLELTQVDPSPAIDGILTPGEWDKAVKAELRYQVFPNQDDTAASEKTEVFITYDRERLYIAFKCFDSDPAGIRAPVSKRDAIDSDDLVTVFLDTYDDKQRAYYFSASAAGVQQDGIYTESSGANETWDGIYESRSALTPEGYTVELAIPFKTLRFKSGEDSKWGVHFRRWIARRSERTSWMPLSFDKPSLLAQAGGISGLKDVFQGSTIDVIPTVTFSNSGTREIDPADPMRGRLNNENKIDPGVTVIYSITPNLTLSATVNPDFSQIESDVPQVSVNQRFPLFFPERRPFFLEGNEFFRSSYNSAPSLVDTRQIVDPDWGAKLTGRIGKNTIGFLVASDNSAGLRLSPDDVDFGKNAQFTIARYTRDISDQKSLGFLFTDRRFAGSYNTVASVDGRLLFGSGKQLFAFQTAFSRTKELDGTTREGGLTYLIYSYTDRAWDFRIGVSGSGRNFSSLTGFIRRTGYQRSYHYVARTFRPKQETWWRSIRPFIVAVAFLDRNGNLDESFFDPGVSLAFAKGVSLYTYFSTTRDNFLGRGYTTRRYVANLGLAGFKYFSLSNDFDIGTGVNFDVSRPEIGDLLNNRLSLTLRPLAKLNSEFLWIKTNLKSQINDDTLFKQDIYRNRTIYQFNRINAVRSIVEYDTLARRIGLSFQYSYTPRPNTAIYFGYGDTLFNGFDPLFQRRTGGFVRGSRSLFAKFSYNIRF